MVKQYSKKSSLNTYAIISIAVVLFILEIYLIIILHSRNLTEYFKEQVSFVVELNEDSTKDQIDKLKAKLISYPEVINERVEYLNKKDALNVMLSEIDPSLVNEDQNPFKDLYIFQLKAESYTNVNIARIKLELTNLDFVSGFYHADESIDNVINNVSKGNWFLLVILAILIGLVLIILFSTIRIKLLNNRFQIKTMELVGAENAYIQKIYAGDGFSIINKSSILSIVLLVLSLVWVYLKFENLSLYLNIVYLLLSVLIAIMMGYIIVYFTTKIQVNSYLSKHFYELYD